MTRFPKLYALLVGPTLLDDPDYARAKIAAEAAKAKHKASKAHERAMSARLHQMLGGAA